MVAFVFSIIIWVIGIIAFGFAFMFGAKYRRTQDQDYATGRNIGAIVGVLAGIGGGLLLFFGSILVSNGVGEAKVYTNPDGTIAFTQTSPGYQTKAPWQDYADFDLFSQELLYAGGDQAPSYSGGTVNGKEVTVSVGGVNGGSTQGNVDISVTYSLDADQVEAIYKKYKSQERFTKQVVEKVVLSVTRSVPSAYTAVEFRGAKKDEASQLILDRVNDKLSELGITVDFVNIQAVRYPENVETALNDVEAANQAALQAEADLQAAKVKAEQTVVEAQAKADANAILAQSLTPEVLSAQYFDTLKSIGKEGNLVVVPQGSTPFVTVQK